VTCDIASLCSMYKHLTGPAEKFHDCRAAQSLTHHIVCYDYARHDNYEMSAGHNTSGEFALLLSLLSLFFLLFLNIFNAD